MGFLRRRENNQAKNNDPPSIEAGPEVLGQAEEVTEQLIFREHYPIVEPYSRVAIAEDREGNLRYLLLEPTLTEEDEEKLKEIKDILWDELNVNVKDILSKTDAEKFLREMVEYISLKYNLKVEPHTLDKYQYYITRDFLNFGKIDGMMRDQMIEDISCDGAGYPIYVWHRSYESIPSNVVFKDAEELDSFILRLAYLCGRHISIAQPLLDGTLPDGSRVQLTFGSEVTPRGSTFTIRKFRANPLTITDLIMNKTLSPEMAAYFWFLIENRHSVMIGGDIGGGKTTMLNCFGLFIRPNLKIVSIEDTQEIKLPHENWQIMVTRQGLDVGAGAIGERGRGAISMFDLLRAALRQRPDYIIVGEIRGEEAYALFQAMSTGHLGLTTVHAEHVQGVLHRLTTKPMDIPPTLVENLDAIAIVRRLVVENVSKRRTIMVHEMGGLDPETGKFITHPIFEWDAASDSYRSVGESIILKEISKQGVYTLEGIQEELEKRKIILEYMVRNNIRTFDEVTSVIMQYFQDPDAVYRKARVS
ncbi:type II/IV secretion system ATPase subunit [Candidatus Bathyarchaeota archaeon]|nr:type II/IV secretion system ATPase subunit [Candidatus Bathyarchaeota archaeon]